MFGCYVHVCVCTWMLRIELSTREKKEEKKENIIKRVCKMCVYRERHQIDIHVIIKRSRSWERDIESECEKMKREEIVIESEGEGEEIERERKSKEYRGTIKLCFVVYPLHESENIPGSPTPRVLETMNRFRTNKLCVSLCSDIFLWLCYVSVCVCVCSVQNIFTEYAYNFDWYAQFRFPSALPLLLDRVIVNRALQFPYFSRFLFLLLVVVLLLIRVPLWEEVGGVLFIFLFFFVDFSLLCFTNQFCGFSVLRAGVFPVYNISKCDGTFHRHFTTYFDTYLKYAFITENDILCVRNQ